MVGKVIGDITEFQGDCIFNSLGEGVRMQYEQGGIFRSILEAVNFNPHYASKIREHSYIEKIGESFITDSYGLPCKKIINIVTPFKKDDPELTVLASCITSAFELAYKHGCRTMCIPLVGSGYNAYSNDESFLTILSCANAFISKHKDADISIFEYNKEKKRRHSSRTIEGETRRFLEESNLWEDRLECPTFGDSFDITIEKSMSLPEGGLDDYHKPLKDMMVPGMSLGELIDSYIEENRHFFKKEYHVTKKKGKYDPVVARVWDFIYITTTSMTEEDKCVDPFDKATLRKNSNARKHNWSYHSTADGECWMRPSKVAVILAGLALRMNKRDILNMCTFCGYYLSEYDSGDMKLMEIISSKDMGGRANRIWSEYPQARGYKKWSQVAFEQNILIFKKIVEI